MLITEVRMRITRNVNGVRQSFTEDFKASSAGTAELKAMEKYPKALIEIVGPVR